MEKTLISFNIPNFITVNLMVWLAFFAFIAIWQVTGKRSALAGGGDAGDDEE